MRRLLIVLAVVSMLTAKTARAQEEAYLPDWHSLARHREAPEWFRDAKFGIYFHWGVYSVPAYGNEWYPRWMYFKDFVYARKYNVYEYHSKTYGPPDKFGYHDLVPLFKAEHFDPEQWARLFQRAGARFAGPVAEHHDGFAMWDSDVTPWNAKDMGPHRDILGELARELRKRGIKLVTTFHHARNLQRYRDKVAEELANPDPRNRFWDSHYPFLKGLPPASDDPKLRLLYGNLPEEEWLERMWWGKLKEVIDCYQPDIIWFDSWLDRIPEEYRKRFCAYYLNRAAEWGKEVVITRKQEDLPLSCSIRDLEKGRMDRLTEECWLTDDTISTGSWCYTQDLHIKPTRTVLHSLIDIVSKNGCLLLNISPKADGTIPKDQQRVLLEIGDWLAVNGEAIYNTRPWLRFGEGPTQLERGGSFIKEPSYTAQDIRFTRSKDDLVLYAILLGWPGEGKKVTIKSIESRHFKVKNVEMLGSDEPIAWELTGHGLVVTMPQKAPNELAVVLKIVKQF